MALDFPDTPTVGQEYSPAGAGRTWEWDGTAWVLQYSAGSSSPPIVVQETEPTAADYGLATIPVDAIWITP